jgi:hypothetical protein
MGLPEQNSGKNATALRRARRQIASPC